MATGVFFFRSPAGAPRTPTVRCSAVDRVDRLSTSGRTWRDVCCACGIHSVPVAAKAVEYEADP